MSKRDSFLLRLRPEVMDALRRWADDEFRSVNGQIEFVLARALQQAGRLPASLPSGEQGAPAQADAPCDPPGASAASSGKAPTSLGPPKSPSDSESA